MPVANGATPDAGFHVGGSFHEFRARNDATAKANQAKQASATPPAEARSNVSRETAKPFERGVMPQRTDTPAADAPPADPNAPPVDALADADVPPADPNAPPVEGDGQNAGPTQEDLDLLAQIKSWRDGDSVPSELAEKLLGKKYIELKNGDDVEYETFEEIKNGRMRAKDHMRGVQTRDAERAEEQRVRESYDSHFHSIGHPETGHEAMYETYTRNGMRPQLKKLAEKLAVEEQEDIDNANGVAYALAMRLGIQDMKDYRVQNARAEALARAEQNRVRDDQSRSEKFEIERLRKANQQRQDTGKQEQHMAVQRKQLEQLRPRAFEALGMDHENPIHRETFNDWLGAAIRTHKVKQLTPEIVMSAARAARDELRDRENARNGVAPKAPVRAFVPQLGPGGGGARQQPSNQPGTNGQGHSADSFAAKFIKRPWQK